tara:strand:- start:1796 stop:2392 length:597 start_codon:yes stop_codon:yes gene_type:complete
VREYRLKHTTMGDPIAEIIDPSNLNTQPLSDLLDDAINNLLTSLEDTLEQNLNNLQDNIGPAIQQSITNSIDGAIDDIEVAQQAAANALVNSIGAFTNTITGLFNVIESKIQTLIDLLLAKLDEVKLAVEVTLVEVSTTLKQTRSLFTVLLVIAIIAVVVIIGIKAYETRMVSKKLDLIRKDNREVQQLDQEARKYFK